MRSSIRRQALGKPVLPLVQHPTVPGYFLWPWKLNPINFITIALLLFPLAAFLKTEAALAQQQPSVSRRPVLTQQQLQQTLQKKHNEAAVMILGGPPGTTYFNLAHDMAATLAAASGPRLIVVDAPGGTESLRDLLLLRGIDLALVPGNVLDYANATGAVGPGLGERLTYVTVLYGEEIHVLAGPGIASIKDLNGKKVAAPVDDGNALFTVHDLLRRLHIGAEVVKVAGADAIDDVRSGALAALVLVGGKPLPLVAALPKDGSLRLLAVPSIQALGDGYSPSSFGADDYPALIPRERTVDTLSVGIVLVANKALQSGEANQRIARFVPAFFGSLSDLAGPRWHPKWREVNLAATLDKWPRFPAAKEWLDTALREQSASVQRDFEEFLRVNGSQGTPSPEVRKQLFDDFLAWTRGMAVAPR
jgi:uncharacterized protein